MNEKFVSCLFSEMVKCKPGLTKYMPDESDLFGSDELDYREISNVITKEFPWPMGIELRRLLSGSMINLNRGRLDQILKTYERTLQYLSFILVINLYEETLNGNIKLDDGFKVEFGKRFRVLTMGNYVWIIHSIISAFKKNKLPFFISEITDFSLKSFMKRAEMTVKNRNELSHYLVNMNDEDIEIKCVECLEDLSSLLCSLSFIVNYPLITIPQITVRKNRNTKGEFDYHMLLLNSASSSFYGTVRTYSEFTESPSVLIIRNSKEIPTESLNLSPLIIDTHFETIDSAEKKLSVKKDVLLYSKFDKNNTAITYVGTESIEKPNATLLSFYENLQQEFIDIFKCLSLS